MRRYLPLLLVGFFVIITVIAGSEYLLGYADQKNPNNKKSIGLYTTLPVELVAALAQEYEKTQNVRVNVVPVSERDIIMRVSMGNLNGDVIMADRHVLELCREKQLLAQHNSEQTDIVPERFKSDDELWTGIWYDPIVFAVNKDFLKKQKEIPVRWSDIQKIEKIRVGITDFLAADASANLLYTMISLHGEKQTLDYFKKLHPKVVQYTKFLATPARMAGMGEVDLSIVVQSEALRYALDGFPIQLYCPEDGTAYFLTGVGIIRGTSHHDEASRFIDWLLSDDAHNVLEQNKLYFVPCNPEIVAKKQYFYKSLKLIDNKQALTTQQKREILDRWVQTVRLAN